MAFEGKTGDLNLSDLLSLCLTKPEAGTCIITASDESYHLTYRSGKIMGIIRTGTVKTTTDILLERKVITTEQRDLARLDAVNQEQIEDSLINTQGITPEQIQLARYAIAEDIFFELLKQTEGKFEFVNAPTEEIIGFDLTFRDLISEAFPDMGKLLWVHQAFPDLDTRFFWISPQDFSGLPELLSIMEMKVLSRYRPNISVRGFFYNLIESRLQILDALKKLIDRGILTTESVKTKPPDSRPFLRALLSVMIDRIESVQKLIGGEGELVDIMRRIAGMLEEIPAPASFVSQNDGDLDDLTSITSSIEGILNIEDLDELDIDKQADSETPEIDPASLATRQTSEAAKSAPVDEQAHVVSQSKTSKSESEDSEEGGEEFESLEDQVFIKVRYRRFVSNVTMAYNRLQMKRLNYFEMLGVPPNADRQTIHKNFVRAIRKINPKGIRLKERDQEFLNKAIVVRDRLKEAYQNLTEPSLRRKYLISIKESRDQEEKKKSDALSLFNKGMTEFKNGNFERAREIFKKAISLDPKSPVYYNMLESIEKEESSINASKFFQAGVLAFTQKKDFDRAVKLIKKAIYLAPGQVAFHLKLAEIFSTRSETRSDAIQNFEIAQEMDPSNIDLRLTYAMYLKNSGAKQDAANRFQEILKWSPDNPVARRELVAMKKEGILPKKSTETAERTEQEPEEDVEL